MRPRLSGRARRLSRTHWVVLACAALLGAIAAFLVCLPYFGSAPPPGEAIGRSSSADGRWLVRDHYVGGGAGGHATAWIEVRPAGGQPWRTVYYGSLADVTWRGNDTLELIEVESETHHRLDLAQGETYDVRVDDLVNLIGGVIYAFLAFCAFTAAGVGIVWASRRSARAAQGPRSAR